MTKYFAALFNALIVLCLCSVFTSAQNCKFDRGNEPHVPGANELISIKLGTFRKIVGTVELPTGKLADDAIVVVYKLIDKERNFVGWQTADDKARFCFGKLPAGKYVIAAGVPGGGINTTEIILTLDPDNWKASDKKIKVKLELGT